MHEMPRIAIHLEGVAQSVIAGFVDHFEEIKQYASNQIRLAFLEIGEKRLQQEIKETIINTMSGAVREGIVKAVRDAVYEQLLEGQLEESVRKAIRQAVKEEFEKAAKYRREENGIKKELP